MRKPVSKHALRRAVERVQAEGRIQLEEPANAVVDRLWHHLEKEALNGARRKTGATTRAAASRRREPATA